MNKVRVGTIGLSYAHKKNFFGLDNKRVQYFKTWDWISPFRYLMRIPLLKKLFGSPFLRNSHFSPFSPGIDLFHFFNTISFSNKPWVCTFETFLPRWGMDSRGLERITSDSCLGIVAMSTCAKNIMLSKVREEFEEYLPKISSKISVIHPSQAQLVNLWEDKGIKLNGQLTFILVGNDFFRKGGKEILEVFSKLIDESHGLELKIVSNLSFGDYASKSTHLDKEWASELISKYPKHIKLFQNIPNTQVLDLIRNSHVGLLPTYADTYGYSVLEMQALACPVVSTDVRALSEINSNEKGWVIEVPKDRFSEGLYTSEKERAKLSEIIKTNLRRIIKEIMEDPQQITKKGEKALHQLSELNDPQKNADLYFKIYQKVLD